MSDRSSRNQILKTYKLYIGGKFPRTESGRYFQPKGPKGEPLANICRGSRKDLRNAVVSARKALDDWQGRHGYNRGQVLYRIAEMLEGRRAQFTEELIAGGSTKKMADKEVDTSIDLLVHYAGWADKYQALISSVNPVTSPHFNFSVPEPMGVVFSTSPQKYPLYGSIHAIAPTICGGNTIIVIPPENNPLVGITLAEVMHASDVPPGVVNIITGHVSELMPHASAHMDINALIHYSANKKEQKNIQEEATVNLKRVFFREDPDLSRNGDLGSIEQTQEVKTTWHPVEPFRA